MFHLYLGLTGEPNQCFVRHDSFMEAKGAFMSYEKHGLDNLL